jgi:hypothetical protein
MTVINNVVGLFYQKQSYTVIQFGVGSASGVQWALYIPSTMHGTETRLYKSTDSGATYYQVSQIATTNLPTISQQGKVQNITLVSFYVKNGHAVFGLMDRAPWTYYDSSNPNGFVCDEGYIQVDHYNNRAFTWNLNARGYSIADSNGNILDPAGLALSSPLQLPSDVNSDPDYHDVFINPYAFPYPDPASPKVSPNFIVDSVITPLDDSYRKFLNIPDTGNPNPPYNIKVQFHPTASGRSAGAFADCTPMLLVTEVVRAKVEQDDVLLYDMAGDTTSISWNLSNRYRGNTMRISARNDSSQYSALGGNEFVNLTLSQITGGDNTAATTATAVNKCAGFISKVSLHHTAKDAGFKTHTTSTATSRGIVEIETNDWELRLRKLPMNDTPNYGGWELQDALINVLNRAGVASAFYDFDPTSAKNIATGAGLGLGYQLSSLSGPGIGVGYTNFLYNDRHNAIHAMDEMCASKGFVWGVDESMVIRAWRPDSFYPRTIAEAYVLDDTNYDPNLDCITAIDVEKDIDAFYNRYIIYSVDSQGNHKITEDFNNTSAYGTYGDPDYIGSVFTDTYHAPAGLTQTDLDNFKSIRAYSRSKYVQFFKWETSSLSTLNLRPRMVVIVNTTGLGIHASPYNQFEIVSEEGRVEWSDTGTKSKITRVLRALPYSIS